MEDIDLKQPSNEHEDIYPMPVFCKLIVKNVEESVNWYKVLGFRSIFAMNDPITQELNFTHLRRHKYQDILLIKGQSDKANNAHGMAITFQAWTDIDVLADHAKSNGVQAMDEPHDTFWNTRDVTFQDNDGYIFTFTYPSQKIIQHILSDEPQKLNKEFWEK